MYLPLLAALVAVAYLLTQSRRSFPGRPVLKAAPILLLALWVGQAAPATSWRMWVVVALILSAAGDIALALPGDRLFITGLLFFLLAHLAYVGGFITAGTAVTGLTYGLGPIILLIGVILGLRLWPNLGAMRIPVVAYMLIIVAMALSATLRQPTQPLLVVGALVFMFSDATIALDRFDRPVPARDWIVMISYYAAQFLLAAGHISG